MPDLRLLSLDLRLPWSERERGRGGAVVESRRPWQTMEEERRRRRATAARSGRWEAGEDTSSPNVATGSCFHMTDRVVAALSQRKKRDRGERWAAWWRGEEVEYEQKGDGWCRGGGVGRW